MKLTKQQRARLVNATSRTQPDMMDFGCGVQAKQQFKAAMAQWVVQLDAIADTCFYGNDKNDFRDSVVDATFLMESKCNK